MKNSVLRLAKRLSASFFEKKAVALAPALLGKVLVRRLADGTMRGCMIVETEAYEYTDKASHSHRGRKGCEAMFATAGTLYMYKIRQWHSLNLSSADYGGGVLIKGACPLEAAEQNKNNYSHQAEHKQGHGRHSVIEAIEQNISNDKHQAAHEPSNKDKLDVTGVNIKQYSKTTINRAFSGQGKLCRQLQLETPEWNGKQFNAQFYLADIGYQPQRILVTPRLNVTGDRQLPYRFLDADLRAYATHPGTKSSWRKQTKIIGPS